MKAEITVGPRAGKGSALLLDGMDVSSAVKGFTLYAYVGEMTRLNLDPAIVLRDGATVTAEVEAYVPEETAELLKLLGWTPPGETALPDVADPADPRPQG